MNSVQHFNKYTLRFFEQATPFKLDQIWSHQTAQTSVWFTTSSEFVSCLIIIEKV